MPADLGSHQTYQYSAYGLTWSTPFPMLEWRQANFDVQVDVTVQLAGLPPAGDDLQGVGPLRQVSQLEARFGLPNVGKMLVRQGQEILIDRHSGADDSLVRLMLVGTAAALVLHQRGVLPLHASGIQTPAGAVLFMGHSGAGKSTLLNAFVRRGYRMVSEDLAAVRLDDDGYPWVSPGVQVTKLWADSAAALGQSTDSLRRVRPELEKFVVPVPTAQLAQEQLPVLAVYALSTHQKPDLLIEERRDVRKFNALLDHTWQKLVVKRMGLHAHHFKLAAAVANKVPIVRVCRPEGHFALDALLDSLEADFHQRQGPAQESA